ncbi:GNAT family N-acetyltransferase [Paenibacillus koleovorans]|uniref:GNAT family N-acetyltransferase n=1 Tax=Paenibacillus koleovorans TaxID=121608 RepID=UPI0013E3BB7A|nr:GNAT family N-acetyltransferase [Paenibacillus koleovorans]
MIRRLREQDCEASLELTEFSFRLNLSAAERMRRLEQMKTDYVLGYYENDILAAKLVILPFRMYLGGKKLDMGGIASVATWPEHRRKGMVGKLITHSLQAMREQGQTVSVLNPFSFVFYRKYGWGYFGEIKRYKYAVSRTTAIPVPGGYVERKSRRDLAVIRDVYEAFAAKYNGMLSRDDAWWEHQVFRRKLGQLAVDFDESGQPRGYVMYSVEGTVLDVKEFIYLDELSRSRLLRFLAMHDSMTEQVTFTAPAGDLLVTLFDTPPARSEVNACYMTRIVDMKGFLEQYPFESDGEEITLRFQVEDQQAPWNNGRFELTIEADGHATATKLELREVELGSADGGAASGQAGWLAGPIHVFSSLFMGFGDSRSYVDSGLLAGDRKTAEMLDRLLSKQQPYILDMF